MSAQLNIVKNTLDNVIAFLEPYLPLVNCHMVDYFTTDAYNRLIPENIQLEVHNIGAKEIINCLLDGNLNRTPHLENYFNSCNKFITKNCTKTCISVDDFYKKLLDGNLITSGIKLNRFMSTKKSHEVEALSALAANIYNISNTSHLIDIGDGKGYLSSMLAMHHKIPILGIDASYINTNSSVKRVEKLSKVWNSLVPNESSNKKETTSHLYKQITCFVNETLDLNQLIEDVFMERASGLGLVGLHTCGDLASSSLKLFTTNDNIRTICNVGCCYHLSETGSISQYLICKGFSIGKTARMVAAQSVDRVLNNKELPPKTIFYRALLEILFNKNNVAENNRQVGRFRKKPNNFIEYVKSSLERLKIDIDLNETELNDFYSMYECKEDELNVFYLLRCMLAPIVENVILLDRLLFLHENGYENAYLLELFKPIVSPRCYCIVALKDF